MNALANHPGPALTTRRFTADEVYRMVETGILRADEKVELIDGELIEVSPQGPGHINTIGAISDVLSGVYRGIGVVRSQGPIDAGKDSIPEPDVAVARGDRSSFRERHPTGRELILAIEVAQSSLALDRAKARVYAIAGVPHYWIVDLAARRIEVHSDPGPDGYSRVEILSDTKDISLPATDVVKKVAELLS